MEIFGMYYFSTTCGFVIDGQHFCSADDAKMYLENEGCMTTKEASHYVDRLCRAFRRREKEVEEEMA